MSIPFSLSSFPAIGFSGSRSAVPPIASAVLPLVPASASVLVGCARGVDQFFRGAFPSAQVFAVSAFGSGRGAFASRSTSFVRALASSGGCLLSFPSGACPSGLVPSASSPRCFCGAGSGSWASLALAIGLGVPCFVFLGSVAAPTGWGLVSLGCGWWAFTPVVVQPSLF